MAGEEQRSSAGKGSTLAGHPGHRDFYCLPEKSLSTGRCGANATSFHLEAKHRKVLGRKMAGWGSAWDKERAAQCELQGGDSFCKQKSESRENSGSLSWRKGADILSMCVPPGSYHFFPSLYRLLASCFTWLESLSTKTASEATGSLNLPSWFSPAPAKPRALSQARRRDQWLALLAWAQA